MEPKAGFKIGDLVEKALGYKYPGVIIGINLVPHVEDPSCYYYRIDVLASHPWFQGMLHIFTPEQLSIRHWPAPLDDIIRSTLKAQGVMQ